MTYWICVASWWIASGVIAARAYRSQRNRDPIGQYKTEFPLLWMAVLIWPVKALADALVTGLTMIMEAWNHGRER